MLDRVSFKNFKSLRSLTLDLSPLTVLVGPNGSGKSSVLQGIHLLSQTGIDRPSVRYVWSRHGEIFSGRLHPRRLASAKAPITITLSMRDASGDSLSVGISIPATSDDDQTELQYVTTVDGPEGRLEMSSPSANLPRGRQQPRQQHLFDTRIRHFSAVAYLHLDATALSRTSTTGEEEPRMADDGAGLGSTLAWLAGAKPDVVHAIAAELARVVPGVRRILVHRERIVDQVMDQIVIDGQPVWRPVERTQLGDRFSIEFDDGTEVPADLLSEGTVLALGLLTKLHEPERPRLLLLDDIDRGLHIGAQSKLVAALRDLMANDPGLQIICTTHSAYLLDLFDPSEVRVLDLDANRGTHAQPLTAHPDFEKWRFGTQTGELWATLGEAWVTNKRRESAP